jgi:hypothetical protein
MNARSLRLTLALALSAMIAGCDDAAREQPDAHAVAPAEPSSEAPAEPREAASTDDQDLLFNEELRRAESDADAVSDEPPDAIEPRDAIDPFAGADDSTAVEVKFIATPSTSVVVAGLQLEQAQQIEKRNERLRRKRLDAEAGRASASASNPESPSNPPAAGSAPAPLPAPAAAAIERAPASEGVPTLDEKAILQETHGQWASAATASSAYGQATAPKAPYSASQATGAPNVERYSDNPLSWTPRSGDSKDAEWLEVKFARAVHATSLRVRQNAGPGAVAKIELIDKEDRPHTVWEGVDKTLYANNTIGWFVKDMPRTDYLVTGARITLATARVWGPNEIDAVQLVGQE